MLYFFPPLFLSCFRVQVLVHASAWALTEYKHVILMEDNMLVVENIDDLFECAGVCAGTYSLHGSAMSPGLAVDFQPPCVLRRHPAKADLPYIEVM